MSTVKRNEWFKKLRRSLSVEGRLDWLPVTSLNRRAKENVVLEKASIAGNVWKNDRWDSFTLLTPNWSFRLPGAEYQGRNPDGYMPREEIVAHFEQYVKTFHLPVQYNTPVNSVRQNIVCQWLPCQQRGRCLGISQCRDRHRSLSASQKTILQ